MTVWLLYVFVIIDGAITEPLPPYVLRTQAECMFRGELVEQSLYDSGFEMSFYKCKATEFLGMGEPV
ncbi:MAG: hypothetical protein JKY32_07165 [Rhizobiales bacterium]|nr:hypothetical protein [Hyphomicrobiales bacterium]